MKRRREEREREPQRKPHEQWYRSGKAQTPEGREGRAPWLVCRPGHLKFMWRMGSDWTEGVDTWMIHGVGKRMQAFSPESPGFKTNNCFSGKSLSKALFSMRNTDQAWIECAFLHPPTPGHIFTG